MEVRGYGGNMEETQINYTTLYHWSGVFFSGIYYPAGGTGAGGHAFCYHIWPFIKEGSREIPH